MRNLMIAGLMATIALPLGAAPAVAQSHHGAHQRHSGQHHASRSHHGSRGHATRTNRHQRRASHQHHRREAQRAQRRARHQTAARRYRDAQRERAARHSRQRWSNNAWRDYRRSHRSLYRAGRWNAPFSYHRFRPGIRLRRSYFASRYWIGDPGYYRLPITGRYQHWVRHYDDVLLIDIRTGMVLRVYRDFFW
ncbi:RcnB family protein [Stakelama sp. CBK3Z-3]|uniref:RcnB family protein n=1 Tax=Stakelama flava TaxID=2860338 RepID=A0ABS6XLF9_9SPHN|nr:RcnB family protein [Stakelama flava]MBW4330643.1 RcnB family protein [Stakelama flava]